MNKLLKDEQLNKLYEDVISKYNFYNKKEVGYSINEIFELLLDSELVLHGIQLEDEFNIINALIELEEAILNDLNMDNQNIKHFIDELYNVYKDKRHDYGDSFNKGIDRFGYISVLTRMYDKVLRINSLKRKQNKVKSESLEDAYKDLFNYSIMLRVYIYSLKK